MTDAAPEQRTVIYAQDLADPNSWQELVALPGVTLTVTEGGFFDGPRATQLTIDGERYRPLGTSVEITRVDGKAATVVTTIAVVRDMLSTRDQKRE